MEANVNARRSVDDFEGRVNLLEKSVSLRGKKDANETADSTLTFH